MICDSFSSFDENLLKALENSEKLSYNRIRILSLLFDKI